VKKAAAKKSSHRWLFILTPEEKRTACFVLLAFLLGLGAKRYRDMHAVAPSKTAIVETAKTVGLPAEKRTEARRRKQAK
jgi:hypothetical protein